MKPVYQRMPRPPHDPEFETRAKALSRALLELHREILTLVRRDYEATRGTQSPAQMYQLLIGDPEFEWLRPLSRSVADLDELLASETDRAPYRSFTARIRGMLFAEGDEDPFSAGYGSVRQHPDVVIAHVGVRERMKALEELLG